MLEIVLAFLGGLLIGSFLNVCIYRLPRDMSVIDPVRSICPGCERVIAWYDNIPILSFFLLRGKCRHCREEIPWRYPLVELFTGLTFAGCIAVFGVTLLALKYLIFSTILIDLIATDLEERILPDEFTKGGIVAGLVLSWFVPLEPNLSSLLFWQILDPKYFPLIESLLGAGIASGAIWFAGWIYKKLRHREGLGLGDVKMIAMIGAFLGLNVVLPILILASVIGAVGGLAYILIARKDASTYEIPFGSFLGAAAFAMALWAEKGADWFSKFSS